MNGRGFLAACALFAAATAFSGGPLDDFPSRKFYIGAYCLAPYAQTEEHVKDIAAAGVDFIAGAPKYDRKLLDLFAKYGVGAIIRGRSPQWWGGDGSKSGRMREFCPIERFEEIAREYEHHPAVWGIDICDEPSARDFPHCAKIVEAAYRLYPNEIPYINLYPNYASTAKNTATNALSQLGTATYAEHIEEYIRKVPLKYICYDFYVYSSTIPQMYANFRVVSAAARRSGKDFWYVAQVNSMHKDVFLSENQLRYQSYLALAFGAKKIIWACWTKGWWHNNVIDTKGEKTAQYEKLKKVNAELHKLGDVRVKYDHLDTELRGDGLVVGYFAKVGETKPSAWLVVGADDPYDEGPKDHDAVVAGRKVQLKSNEAVWICE